MFNEYLINIKWDEPLHNGIAKRIRTHLKNRILVQDRGGAEL
jgi:hypothetical protein